VELDCDWCKAQVGSHCDCKEPYQYMASRVYSLKLGDLQ
jgi:hypothetical protein